jgi:hypothetical protein
LDKSPALQLHAQYTVTPLFPPAARLLGRLSTSHQDCERHTESSAGDGREGKTVLYGDSRLRRDGIKRSHDFPFLFYFVFLISFFLAVSEAINVITPHSFSTTHPAAVGEGQTDRLTPAPEYIYNRRP